ncbi:MAG: hypothetical protein ACXWQ4_11295 [Bdellovibrio sp.]
MKSSVEENNSNSSTIAVKSLKVSTKWPLSAARCREPGEAWRQQSTDACHADESFKLLTAIVVLAD